MTPFDYLSVLLSIVLGLSITQLLGSFAAMIRARDRIDWYWPLPVLMLSYFLINVQVWWALFVGRDIRHWTFSGFFIILMQPVTLYLMSAFTTPDVPATGRLDMRDFYFREKSWFFAATLATLLASLAKDIFVLQGAPPADFAAHGIFFAMALAGILSNSDRTQKVMVPILLALLFIYIGLLFVTLRG